MSADEAERLGASHSKHFLELWDQIRPLPGARELLSTLTAMRVPWAIATSGSIVTAKGPLGMLGIPEGTPIITRDQVAYAKPNPDLFLAAAERLHIPPGDCFVVGDSIWDLLAAQRAGAYRVYDDPADLLAHADELGMRAAG